MPMWIPLQVLSCRGNDLQKKGAFVMHRQILTYKSIPGIFGEKADFKIWTRKLEINQKNPELLENKETFS